MRGDTFRRKKASRLFKGHIRKLIVFVRIVVIEGIKGCKTKSMKTLTISKQAPGLFDYVNRMAELQEHSSALDRLDQVIDWERFRPTLEKTLEGSAQGPGGRPRYAVVMMFKILVLQRYYHLSEEQTEYQIKDRLSFQKFLGLTLAESNERKKSLTPSMSLE